MNHCNDFVPLLDNKKILFLFLYRYSIFLFIYFIFMFLFGFQVTVIYMPITNLLQIQRERTL